MSATSIVARDVSRELQRDFKAACTAQDYTVRDAVIWFAEQIAEGKIKLPRKT